MHYLSGGNGARPIGRGMGYAPPAATPKPSISNVTVIEGANIVTISWTENAPSHSLATDHGKPQSRILPREVWDALKK